MDWDGVGRAGGHPGLKPASPRPLTMLKHGPTAELCEANLCRTLAQAEYYSYWTPFQKLQGPGRKICSELTGMCAACSTCCGCWKEDKLE